MSEQEEVQTATAVQSTTQASACPHPEAVGKRWGDPIDEELQRDLQNYLDDWEEKSDHGERNGPFQKVRLSGADVFWLAGRVRGETGYVPDLHLEGASLAEAHLEGASLAEAHLKRASLAEAHLEGANLTEAHLEGADLTGAHLEGANLTEAHLEAALNRAHLEGADLTGAYLAGADLTGTQLAKATLSRAHLEEADLSRVHLEGADLTGAYLAGADLTGTQLAKATLIGAHLEEADLSRAQLEGADLGIAYLTDADLTETHLEGADLRRAHLEGAFAHEAHLEGAYLGGAQLAKVYLGGAQLAKADLSRAQLEGANLGGAQLAGANLTEVHLEGADLGGAQLEGANLTGAAFDKATRLNDAVLIGASFDQVSFDNTNLTVVDWSLVTTLGDERAAWTRNDVLGKPKTRDTRLKEYKAAVRANRVLAVSLQVQGLAEDAARFAYQAQVLQRQVLRFQRKLGAYLFSWLLAGLAGYGYRLRRILIAYGLAVLLFAIGYFLAGGVTDQAQAHLSLPQQALDALQVSLNAIHGRVFFTQLGLDTVQSWLATLESIVGIVIEGVFVAMLIQRFFGR